MKYLCSNGKLHCSNKLCRSKTFYLIEKDSMSIYTNAASHELDTQSISNTYNRMWHMRMDIRYGQEEKELLPDETWHINRSEPIRMQCVWCTLRFCVEHSLHTNCRLSVRRRHRRQFNNCYTIYAIVRVAATCARCLGSSIPNVNTNFH